MLSNGDMELGLTYISLPITVLQLKLNHLVKERSLIKDRNSAIIQTYFNSLQVL